MLMSWMDSPDVSQSIYLQYTTFLLQLSMGEGTRAAAFPLVLLEQEDAYTGQHEYAYAGIHGEGVIYHQE